MRRDLNENDQELPPDGWVIALKRPPSRCSWCGDTYTLFKTLWACPTCDPIDEWRGHV